MASVLQNKIAQLKATLETVKPNTKEHVDTLNQLAWEQWTSNAESAETLTVEAMKMAQKLDYERGIYFAKLNFGIKTWREDTTASFQYLMDAYEWFKKVDEKEGEAHASGFLGIAYWGMGDFERGFELTNISLESYRAIGNTEGEGWMINSLGGFYFDIKNYDESLKYFQLAHDIFEKDKNHLGEARSLNGIGNINLHQGKCKRALVYQNKAMRILETEKNDFIKSRILNDIGLIYQSFDDLENAERYHKESLALRIELNYNVGQTTTLLDLGDLYTKKEVYEVAIRYYTEALAIADRINAKPKSARAQKSLAAVYEKSGDFQKALIHWKAFHKIEETIYHEDTDNKLRKLRDTYKLESSRKEAEIYRLRNVELKSKNDMLEDTIKTLNAMQAQLIQSGKMVALGNLVAGIAHEINTPIGVIYSGTDILNRGIQKLLDQQTAENNTSQSRTVKSLQATLKSNLDATQRIRSLVQSLKNFARLDEADFQKADINEGLEATLSLLNHEITKPVSINKQFGKLPKMFIYPGELNQVFMNILMNAVQATDDNGKIDINTIFNNQQAIIEIKDSGKGIPSEKVNSIFQPGFTKNGSRIKMRTGLYTSYNIIKKHFGDINVTSQLNQGTTFTISIPNNIEELIKLSHEN